MKRQGNVFQWMCGVLNVTLKFFDMPAMEGRSQVLPWMWALWLSDQQNMAEFAAHLRLLLGPGLNSVLDFLLFGTQPPCFEEAKKLHRPQVGVLADSPRWGPSRWPASTTGVSDLQKSPGLPTSICKLGLVHAYRREIQVPLHSQWQF